MTTCTRPDCSGGTLDEEGVCDTCFRAPAAPRGATPRCTRSDCSKGRLDEEGVCEICFRAPARWVGRRAPGGVPPLWFRVPWESGPRPAPAPLRFPPGPARHHPVHSELGLGILDIPPVRPRSPEEALLDDPVVEEWDRRCRNSACRTEVGRGVGGAPGAPEGECHVCGTAFSFRPPLAPGELLGQYRIRGCVGRGGQGWVYLANDLNLDDDPVAVKGLRDSAHKEVLAAERRTLIAVRHPGIVDIRNFVQHRDPVTRKFDGYIVLEFLDGPTLADIALRTGGVLPVGEAVAYVLATLPALGYLHDSGLVYRDFKPHNIIQVGDRVKLVDFGAVSEAGRPADDRAWATRGFAAPEIWRRASPSQESDLYSVGRTLAALTARFELTDADGANLPLPGPDEVPVFGQYESFYRLLLRATAEDPAERFESAGQLAEQLAGVLREVVALDRDRPQPTPSTLFTLERGGLDTDLRSAVDPVAAALALPAPRPDDRDPAVGFLGTVTATEPQEVAHLLGQAPRRTPEVAFRLLLARVALREFEEAGRLLTAGDGDPDDWRRTWYRGVVELARGEPEAAWHAFAAIRDALPGEPAPKLALAACAEALGAYDLARHYYRTVWRTDDTFVGAAFGVARSHLSDPAQETGDQPVKVLEAIPSRLHHHVAAWVEALRLRLDRADLDLDGLREAARRLQDLRVSDEQELLLRVRLWKAARAWLARSGPAGGPPGALLGVDLTDDALGRELERVYLALREFVPRRKRVALVRNAHAARPRTRW